MASPTVGCSVILMLSAQIDQSRCALRRSRQKESSGWTTDLVADALGQPEVVVGNCCETVPVEGVLKLISRTLEFAELVVSDEMLVRELLQRSLTQLRHPECVLALASIARLPSLNSRI